MNLIPVQLDFSSGELTPELFMRPDLQVRRGNLYQAGLKECINFWTDSRGPLRSRDGFRYIGAVIADAVPERICDANTLTFSQDYSFNNPDTGGETSATGYAISPDGLYLIMTSGSAGSGRGRGFYVFRFGTPYDFDTLSFSYPADWYEYTSPFPGNAGVHPTDLSINGTATRMYSTDGESEDTGLGGGSDPRIMEFDITGWDLSGGPLELGFYVMDSAVVGTQDPIGIEVSPDNKYLYVYFNNTSHKLFQYEMFVPGDINAGLTLVQEQVIPLPTGPGVGFMRGLRFEPSGKRFLTIGGTSEVWVFDLDVAWDISTVSYTKTLQASLTVQPLWPVFIDDCQFLSVLAGGADRTFDKYEVAV